MGRYVLKLLWTQEMVLNNIIDLMSMAQGQKRKADEQVAEEEPV